MLRIIIIGLSVVGMGWLLGRCFPSSEQVAFTIGSFGITWIMLAAAGTAIIAYKITK